MQREGQAVSERPRALDVSDHATGNGGALDARDVALHQLQRQLEDAREQLTGRERELRRLRGELELRDQRLAELEPQLVLLAETRWRLLVRTWQLRLSLLPPNRRRTRAVKRVLRLALRSRPLPLRSGPPPAGPTISVPLATAAPADAPALDLEGGIDETGLTTASPAPTVGSDPAIVEQRLLPLVSVVLPVRDQVDLLPAAVDSVLAQSYPNLELILLDDGSSEDIEPVLRRLATCAAVTILRQPNQKLPRALTHAHAHARGQLITWTSADNLLAPDALAVLVDTLLRNPEAAGCYADVALIDDAGRPLVDGSYRPQNLDPHRPDVLRLYRGDAPLGHEADNYLNACFAYRAEAADALERRYADDLPGAEDYDFWLRLQKHGPLVHTRHPEPLYHYRVHQRTMSHDLLTRDRGAHLRRISQLLELEALRRSYAGQRWTLVADEGLPGRAREALARAARALPVDLVEGGEGWQPSRKRLRVMAAGTPADRIRVRATADGWRLEWESADGVGHAIDHWAGVELPPLALKAREHRANPWEFPQAAQHPVVGAHLPLARVRVDVERARATMAANPDRFFVFLDVPGHDDPAMGRALTRDAENAVYLGSREVGVPYATYACFTACWLPPAHPGGCPRHEYRWALACAFAMGRVLLVPDDLDTEPAVAPAQIRYQPGQDARLHLPAPEVDAEILDRHLREWRPSACLHRLLRAADAVTQEWTAARPDFGVTPAPVRPPTVWGRAPERDRPVKALLAVEHLDAGGLEEVVAVLASHLRTRDVDAAVLCAGHGGRVAERLTRHGVRVHVAGGDPARAVDVLDAERPHVVNSHLAPLPLLEAAAGRGIPVVETVHNSYVWFDDDRWAAERARSRHVTRLLAVSELVKRYYLTWHGQVAEDAVEVVPNAVPVPRNWVVDRSRARAALGIGAEEFLFVGLGRYDGQKNQLGTVAAFDRAAAGEPGLRLLLAGEATDQRYHRYLAARVAALGSRPRIRLDRFHQDVRGLLSAADAFVVNSFFEGWSLAATEAVLAGVPLIHSRCGSALELVGEDGRRGVVVDNPGGNLLRMDRLVLDHAVGRLPQVNTEQLTDEMCRMARERETWSRRRGSIRGFASRVFTVEAFLAGYARTFRSLASA